jgi:phosphoribosylanthranilate isomerase
MFRVKICGITNVEDALAAVEAGADAIGLNFYKNSPRCINFDVARHIADATDVVRVGVVVNESIRVMTQAWSSGELSFLQIHGDETPEMLKPVAFMDLITVRRMAPQEADVLEALQRDMMHFAAVIGWAPPAMMVDSAAPGQYGGTGTTANWQLLHGHERRLGHANLILAGGLTPDNVAEAIGIVRPAAVDVASGVESAPGKKDPAKVRDFVANALGAFEALGP